MSGAPIEHADAGIDLAAGLERVMGDRDMFLRILGRFAADYRDLAARLHAALYAEDAVLAQRIAHTLKGAAGMIAADRLCALALEVELALKAGGAAPLVLIARLDAELARVLAHVEALLTAPHTPEVPVIPADLPAQHDLAQLRGMLDIGDGRASELVMQLRGQLQARLGSEAMPAFEAAVRRYDFERALALLDRQA